MRIITTFYLLFVACSSLCWACSDASSDNCEICSDTGFRYGSSCVAQCPSGYRENKDYRICETDSPLVGTSDADAGNKAVFANDRVDAEEMPGCLVSEYYDSQTKKCVTCT